MIWESNERSRLRAEFTHDGFAVLPKLVTPTAIHRVQGLLDPLFDRFDTLGDRGIDLAGPITPHAGPLSAEVKSAVRLKPRLLCTSVYRRCARIARHLLGVPVGYVFDHAIFKQPNTDVPTEWHQDEAYNPNFMPLRSIHFWIPLQPANVANGCMWFIPHSHRGGLLPHHTTPRSVGQNYVASGVDTTTAVACPLEVGDVAIHHPLTVHSTGPNHTADVRRAWILHFSAYGAFSALLHPKNVAARRRARRHG